ncbi:MAG: glycosyltransferase family 4 protein [Candidatus Terrybacteria bacterium]|nr:glycosyltransferase family 4 protein [Candidatus Terrybacteria bacterium]
MRIGIDARMLGSAPGIGRYIARLTSELFLLERESEYVLFLREPSYSAYRPARERIRKVYAPERWYGWMEQLTLPWRFMREQFDLLFVPQFNVPLFLPRPFVVTIHDLTQLYVPGPAQLGSVFRRLAFRLVFSMTIRRARAIIAVSEYTKREIIKNFSVPAHRIVVIPEGPGFSLKTEDAAMSASPHSEPALHLSALRGDGAGFQIPDSRYILAVGVWRPHKNFEGLLEAFARVKRDPQYSDLLLILVGEEDPRYPEVRARILALGLTHAVRTPGVVQDTQLDKLYRNAAAVVIPSRYEGFGFVGLEALARGSPVAASSAAAIPEVLGYAALYFNPDDTEEMASVIGRLLTDAAERQRILKAAPAVLERYSWRHAAEETLRLFKSVLAEGGR